MIRLLVSLLLLVPLAASAGIPVEGKVVGPDGQGLAGARVEIRPVLRVYEQGLRELEGRGEPEPAARTTTEPGGWYRLEAPREGIWRVAVSAPGFVSLESSPMPLLEETSLQDALLKPDHGLLVRIEGADGRPVAGAEIRAFLQDHGGFREVFRVRSSDRGRFRMPILWHGRSYELLASAPGRAPARESVTLVEGTKESSGLRLVLGPGRSVRGQVVDPDGRPVADAVVTATFARNLPEPGQEEAGPVLALRQGSEVVGRVLDAAGRPVAGASLQANASPASAWSDGQGRFRMSGVKPGPLVLSAIHLEHGRASRTIEVVPGENRLDLTLEPEEKRRLQGRVVGPDGEPVQGALVEGRTDIRAVYMYSRADGSFFLDVGAEGGFSLVARKEGYSPARLDDWSVAGATEGLELRLARMSVVSGRILGVAPEDLPRVTLAANSDTLMDRQAGIVDADGSYRIAGLAPGDWSVLAEVGGRRASAKVALLPEQEAHLDLFIPSRQEVSGRVFGAQGEPVAQARVTLAAAAAPGSETASSREDGSFSLEVEDGTYALLVEWEGFAHRLDEPVTVDGAPVGGLEVHLGGPAPVSGRILGLSPEAVAQTTVRAEAGAFQHPGTVAADGTYLIGGLGAGEWQVTAESGLETATGRLTIRPGQERAELDLLFSPGTLTLSGRIEAYRSGRFVLVDLERIDSPRGQSGLYLENAGEFRFTHLRPGRYRLTLYNEFTRPVVVQEIDLSADVELVIPFGTQP